MQQYFTEASYWHLMYFMSSQRYANPLNTTEPDLKGPENINNHMNNASKRKRTANFFSESIVELAGWWPSNFVTFLCSYNSVKQLHVHFYSIHDRN